MLLTLIFANKILHIKNNIGKILIQENDVKMIISSMFPGVSLKLFSCRNFSFVYYSGFCYGELVPILHSQKKQ